MGKEHLTLTGWKKLKYPDRELEKALTAYEKAAKDDPSGRLSAIEDIDSRIYELEKKKDLAAALKKYLGEMEQELKEERIAAKEEIRLNKAIAKSGTGKPGKEEEEEDAALEAALKKVIARGAEPEQPLAFVACIGKQVGLSVVKTVQTKHRTALADKIGTRRYVEGECVFDSGAFIFKVPERAPPGLAKRLKKLIETETPLKPKIKIRCADGSELDDEADDIPEEEVVKGTAAGTREEARAGIDVGREVERIEGIEHEKRIARLKTRLAALIKTASYARKQAPDEKVRILRDVEAALVREIGIVESVGRGGVPKEAVEFRQRLGELIDETRDAAGRRVEDDVKAWQQRLGQLGSSASDPAQLDAVGRAGRATLLLEAIDEIEDGIHLDRAMLARLGLDKTSLFSALEQPLKRIRAEYAALAPKRTSDRPPLAAPEVTRPKLGALGGEFDEVVGRIETAMATEKQPSAQDLQAMIKQIDTQLAPKRDTALVDEFHCSWDQVKARFKALAKNDKNEATKFMSDFWWFRRRTVDQLMLALQLKYNFDWASVGSANLESDYDISVRTHGYRNGRDGERFYDWEIVNEFNKQIAKRFKGVQPGTLFDTNLYASAKVEPPPPSAQRTPTERSMDAMTEAGQDVGALMKMRRYMDWEAYEDYRRETLAEMREALRTERDAQRIEAIEAQVAATERQFEEADSLYFISLYDQLKQAGADVPRDLSPEGQKQLLAAAHALEHDPDKLMATNNKLYVDAMKGVRTIEAKLDDEKDPEKRAALLAELRTHQANATFFAAEAYHSEGPLKHIVEANQSSAAKVKNEHPDWPKERKDQEIARLTKEAIGKLSATQMLQSFNENLGDLLKDLRHYEEKSPFPGLGFYRSSKYLERLCDAMEKIGEKLQDEAPSAVAEFARITIAGKTPSAVKAGVGGLVAIRGGKMGFVDKTTDPTQGVDDPEAEKEAYAIDEMAKIVPGITTLRDLAQAMTKVGRQVNAVLRRAELGRKMIAEDDRAYFRA